jgi:predicted Rossmann fold flavoprotein
MPSKSTDVIVIGAGAAGFFTAINLADKNPDLKILILERGKEVLTKVKISGGGRCNVTHAEFVPKELTANYPRGEKELLGPFHRFMTGDTIAWFEKRGVALKVEEDGRMFPVSDSSQTIIDCFQSEVDRLGVMVLTGQPVRTIQKDVQQWKVITTLDEFSAKAVVLATGSNPKIWKLLEGLGHSVVPPVASLFTFNIDDMRIKELPGVTANVRVKVISEKNKVLLESKGPLLITHWGMSGPVILKLSAWGARLLEPLHYRFTIQVNWLGDADYQATQDVLKNLKISIGKKQISKNPQFELPKRLWKSIVNVSGILDETTWADLKKDESDALASELTRATFKVAGKSTFKEEFVTAGGVELKEVDFRTFESKYHEKLYFAGEVLNIDAITGGFNFQNAWTGGYIVAEAISQGIK